MTIMSDVAEIKSADLDYYIAEHFYDGVGVKETFANKRLEALLGADAERYRINIAKRGVDGVLDKLVITGYSITIDGAKSPAVDAAFKRNVWDYNKLDSLLPDALETAEEYGDAYLLCWPVEEESASEVDVLLHKPIGARMFYDRHNEKLPMRYVRTWLVKGSSISDDQTTWYRRVNILEADRVRKLVSTVPAVSVMSDENFEPYTGEDVAAEDGAEPLPPGESVNPYGVIPVSHLRTRRPYGVPEHFSLYGCQNLLIKVIATLGGSVDGFGLPWRYRTMSTENMLSPGSDILDQDDEDDAARRTDRVRTRSGELSNLWDTDTVGQLMPADVNNLLDPIDKVMQLAATVSTTPLDYFDASAASASGESKKEHKGPYLAKVGKRRTDLGSAIREGLEFILVDILGYVGAEVALLWQDLIERTRTEVYAQIKAGTDAGLPWEVACLEAGYPQETIDEWILNGWHPDDSPSARAELFKTVAAGTRDLAAAAQLGGVDVNAVMGLVQEAVASGRARREIGA